MTANAITLRIILSFIFVGLCPSGLFAQGTSDEMFSVRSTDIIHPLWVGLESTMTEIQKDSQASLFSIEHKEGAGSKAANGRFVLCIAGMLAEKRGYKFFRNSDIVDDHMLVVFMNNENENIQAIKSRYSDYPLFDDTGPVEMMKEMCGF